MKTIILASASPRRKKLLEQINLNFITAPQDIVETIDHQIEPNLFAVSTARRKAEKAASSIADALIIGSDTIVVHDDKVLGKPSDETEAFYMLSQLSDNSHLVITGVTLIITGPGGNILNQTEFSEHTTVTFSKLNKKEILEYIKTGSPMDKAGAYGIQDDWGSVFVSQIKGDYYNVVGFPLHKFYQTLKNFAPQYLPKASANIWQ
ncbi:MAG: Maf family protein [Balneolales bacterium]